MNCRMETAASVMSFLHQVYDDRVSVSESRLLSPVCFLQPVSCTNLIAPECWVSGYGTCMCYISRSTRTSIVTDPRAWKYPKEEAQLLPFTYISFVREWLSKLPAWDAWSFQQNLVTWAITPCIIGRTNKRHKHRTQFIVSCEFHGFSLANCIHCSLWSLVTPANATKRSGHFHNDLVTWPYQSSKIVRLVPWPPNTPISFGQSKVPERRTPETPRSHHFFNFLGKSGCLSCPRFTAAYAIRVQQRPLRKRSFQDFVKVVMTRKTILLNGSNHG